ncbi:unnamed protein product [Chrysodeixis includens]|uniref:Uncharacterized protein n=1 Tax=Chrysodeixis includens TaxID=689277 RepID=A0A9P0BT89_CHRIL|nr:unnamed protein product [Chrysodeixis includens]
MSQTPPGRKSHREFLSGERVMPPQAGAAGEVLQLHSVVKGDIFYRPRTNACYLFAELPDGTACYSIRDSKRYRLCCLLMLLHRLTTLLSVLTCLENKEDNYYN